MGRDFLDPLFSLKDQVALVTSAGRGLGRSMALAPGYFLTRQTEPLF